MRMATEHEASLPKAVFRLLTVLPITVFLLTLAACSTASRHRTVVYDEQWSSAAGVKNLRCALEIRESCALRARETEAAFATTLSVAFRTSPDCSTVQFIIASGNDKISEYLEQRLASNSNQYWRLRIDFHPGLTRQPFLLGRGKDRPLIGGNDAEHNAAYICQAVKNNGVMAYW